MLTINQQPISEWFKEQWEKLQQHLRNSVQKEHSIVIYSTKSKLSNYSKVK